MRHTLALLLLVPFGVFSMWLVGDVGPVGFMQLALRDGVSVQVFMDLGIALALLFGFMKRDAERHGVALWPWFVLMLAIGSISPLMYLVYMGLRGRERCSGATMA